MTNMLLTGAYEAGKVQLIRPNEECHACEENDLNRGLLVTTNTELSAMAAPAMSGLR